MVKTEAHAEDRNETTEMVAANLRDFMDAERWSGRKFALALGLQPVYVQRRMSGEVELSASDLKLFGDKLGHKVQDFFIKHERDTPRPGGGAGRRNFYLMGDVNLRPGDYKAAPSGELIHVDFGRAA